MKLLHLERSKQIFSPTKSSFRERRTFIGYLNMCKNSVKMHVWAIYAAQNPKNLNVLTAFYEIHRMMKR